MEGGTSTPCCARAVLPGGSGRREVVHQRKCASAGPPGAEVVDFSVVLLVVRALHARVPVRVPRVRRGACAAHPARHAAVLCSVKGLWRFGSVKIQDGESGA